MTILSMAVPRIHISLGEEEMESKLFKKFELYQGPTFSMKFWENGQLPDFKNRIIQIQTVVKQAKGISLLNVFSLFHFLWVASLRMTWLLSWAGLPFIHPLSESILSSTEGARPQGALWSH